MKLHTLTYVRRATKSRDGHEGLLYVHQWPTGFQELVFENETLATKFLQHLNVEDVQPTDAREPQP